MKVRRVSLIVLIIALIICAFLLFGSWKWGWGRKGSTGSKDTPGATPATAKEPAKQPCVIRVDKQAIWVEETPRRIVDSAGAVAYCKLRGGPVTLKIIFDAPHGVATQVEQAFAKSGLPVEVVRPGR